MSNERINKPEDLLGKLPTIGEDVHDKKLIKDAIDEFVKVLDPIMGRMGQAITEIQQRVAQVEEILNGALVDILAERIKSKLGMQGSLDILMGRKESLPEGGIKKETKKTAEEKAWDGEGIESPEGQIKEAKK